jgi:hypothetical protein
MTDFAIAANSTQALSDDCARARTAHDAAMLAGGPVAFAVEPLPEQFPDVEMAMAAAPDLFARGGEVMLYEGAYRVFLRFWRPLPPLPVASTAREAVAAPLGYGRTAAEAALLAGAPVEAFCEPLPARYASIQAARRKWGTLIDAGMAEVMTKGARFAVGVKFWRPTPPEVAMEDLAARLSAPLKARLPQAAMDIGLFESRSPENPDVVLVAEEGYGRRQQE